MTALTEAQAAVTSAEATVQRLAADRDRDDYPAIFDVALYLAADRLARAKEHLAQVQAARP